jgi:hypothetical protein
MKRPWTRKEQEIVRLHYGPLAKQPWPTSRIAQELRRSLCSIRTAARTIGVSWGAYERPDPRALRAMHAQGMSDVKIALSLNCARLTVRAWRVGAGLPVNSRGGRPVKEPTL